MLHKLTDPEYDTSTEITRLLELMLDSKSKLSTDGACHKLIMAISNAMIQVSQHDACQPNARNAVFTRAQVMLTDIRVLGWVDPLQSTDLCKDMDQLFRNVLIVIANTGLDHADYVLFKEYLYLELCNLESDLFTRGLVKE